MIFNPKASVLLSAVLSRSLGVCLLLVACIGCQRSDWGTVTGVVTVDGQPVGPGTLVFEPAEQDRRNDPSSLGYFDATGKYELLSAGKTQGAKVGEYKVLLMEGSPASLAAEDPNVKQSDGKIPSKYKDYGAQLSATVKPGSQVIDFNLKSD